MLRDNPDWPLSYYVCPRNLMRNLVSTVINTVLHLQQIDNHNIHIFIKAVCHIKFNVFVMFKAIGCCANELLIRSAAVFLFLGLPIWI